MRHNAESYFNVYTPNPPIILNNFDPISISEVMIDTNSPSVAGSFENLKDCDKIFMSENATSHVMEDFKMIEVNETEAIAQQPFVIRFCTGKCTQNLEPVRKCIHSDENLASFLVLKDEGILKSKFLNLNIKNMINVIAFLSSSTHSYHQCLAALLRKEAKDICQISLSLNKYKKGKIAKSLKDFYSSLSSKTNGSNSKFNECKIDHNVFYSGVDISEFMKDTCKSNYINYQEENKKGFEQPLYNSAQVSSIQTLEKLSEKSYSPFKQNRTKLQNNLKMENFIECNDNLVCLESGKLTKSSNCNDFENFLCKDLSFSDVDASHLLENTVDKTKDSIKRTFKSCTESSTPLDEEEGVINKIATSESCLANPNEIGSNYVDNTNYNLHSLNKNRQRESEINYPEFKSYSKDQKELKSKREITHFVCSINEEKSSESYDVTSKPMHIPNKSKQFLVCDKSYHLEHIFNNNEFELGIPQISREILPCALGVVTTLTQQNLCCKEKMDEGNTFNPNQYKIKLKNQSHDCFYEKGEMGQNAIIPQQTIHCPSLLEKTNDEKIFQPGFQLERKLFFEKLESNSTSKSNCLNPLKTLNGCGKILNPNQNLEEPNQATHFFSRHKILQKDDIYKIKPYFCGINPLSSQAITIFLNNHSEKDEGIQNEITAKDNLFQDLSFSINRLTMEFVKDDTNKNMFAKYFVNDNVSGNVISFSHLKSMRKGTNNSCQELNPEISMLYEYLKSILTPKIALEIFHKRESIEDFYSLLEKHLNIFVNFSDLKFEKFELSNKKNQKQIFHTQNIYHNILKFYNLEKDVSKTFENTQISTTGQSSLKLNSKSIKNNLLMSNLNFENDKNRPIQFSLSQPFQSCQNKINFDDVEFYLKQGKEGLLDGYLIPIKENYLPQVTVKLRNLDLSVKQNVLKINNKSFHNNKKLKNQTVYISLKSLRTFGHSLIQKLFINESEKEIMNNNNNIFSHFQNSGIKNEKNKKILKSARKVTSDKNGQNIISVNVPNIDPWNKLQSIRSDQDKKKKSTNKLWRSNADGFHRNLSHEMANKFIEPNSGKSFYKIYGQHKVNLTKSSLEKSIKENKLSTDNCPELKMKKRNFLSNVKKRKRVKVYCKISVKEAFELFHLQNKKRVQQCLEYTKKFPLTNNCKVFPSNERERKKNFIKNKASKKCKKALDLIEDFSTAKFPKTNAQWKLLLNKENFPLENLECNISTKPNQKHDDEISKKFENSSSTSFQFVISTESNSNNSFCDSLTEDEYSQRISDSLENPSPCIENEDSDSGKDVLSIYDGDMREDLQELLIDEKDTNYLTSKSKSNIGPKPYEVCLLKESNLMGQAQKNKQRKRKNSSHSNNQKKKHKKKIDHNIDENCSQNLICNEIEMSAINCDRVDSHRLEHPSPSHNNFISDNIQSQYAFNSISSSLSLPQSSSYSSESSPSQSLFFGVETSPTFTHEGIVSRKTNDGSSLCHDYSAFSEREKPHNFAGEQQGICTSSTKRIPEEGLITLREAHWKGENINPKYEMSRAFGNPSYSLASRFHCPTLPKGFCYKFYFEKRCVLSRCQFSHKMGDNELIEFLRDLIPYYLEKQRGGLASKILNFHFKSRKGENFHFAVAVLKNLAKVFLEEGDKGFLIPELLKCPLTAAKVDILCGSGDGKGAFRVLFDVFSSIKDQMAKKYMFFSFIRFCDIHSDANRLSPFARIRQWGYTDGVSENALIRVFQVELDKHWLLFYVQKNNYEMVKKCYHLLIEAGIFSDYFVSLSLIYINFLQKNQHHSQVFEVLAHIRGRDLKDPRLFVAIASSLEQFVDKTVAHQFFETLFKLEPRVSKTGASSLIDIAVRHDAALAIDVIHYALKVCECEPSAKQLSKIVSRLKGEAGEVKWVLLRALVKGLSYSCLRSLVPFLQKLLLGTIWTTQVEELIKECTLMATDLGLTQCYRNNNVFVGIATEGGRAMAHPFSNNNLQESPLVLPLQQYPVPSRSDPESSSTLHDFSPTLYCQQSPRLYSLPPQQALGAPCLQEAPAAQAPVPAPSSVYYTGVPTNQLASNLNLVQSEFSPHSFDFAFADQEVFPHSSRDLRCKMRPFNSKPWSSVRARFDPYQTRPPVYQERKRGGVHLARRRLYRFKRGKSGGKKK